MFGGCCGGGFGFWGGGWWGLGIGGCCNPCVALLSFPTISPIPPAPTPPPVVATDPIRFGRRFQAPTFLGATAQFIGLTGSNTVTPNNRVDGEILGRAGTYSNFRVDVGIPAVPTQIDVGLYLSTDNGQTYNLIAAVTIPAGQTTANVNFGPLSLAATAMLAVGITAQLPQTETFVSAVVT